MTKSIFLQNLTGQFTGFKDTVLADIGSEIERYTEEDIGRVWAEFKGNYTPVSAPRWVHIAKLAQTAGIFPANRGGARREQYESICYLCASHGRPYRYPVADHGCPNCGNLFWPWTGVGRAGVQVNQERAREIVAMYTQGPHHVLSIVRSQKDRAKDNLRDETRQEAREMANAGKLIEYKGPESVPPVSDADVWGLV